MIPNNFQVDAVKHIQEGSTVQDLIEKIYNELHNNNDKDILNELFDQNACLKVSVTVNGEISSKNKRLKDNDVVVFLDLVSGG